MRMVEWKKLSDVAVIKNGKDYKQLSSGTIPVYGTGGIMTYVDQFASDKPSVLLPRKGSVENVYYVEEPFWTVDTLYWTDIDTSKIIPKFFFISLQRYNLKEFAYGGARPSLSQQILYNLDIPLPSLSEQKRIVGILDTFTSSIENLKQQIEERRKQYEYYRDQLLDLEGEEGVEIKTLNDILISLKTGLNPRKNFILNSPGSINYYITVRELGLFDIMPVDKTDRVTDEALKLINNRSNLEVGDVLFSGTGTIGRTALIKEKPNNWNIKEGVYTLKPRKEIINSRYLVQILHANSTIEKIKSLIVGDPIRSIPMKSLLTIAIPIPSLDEQSRIVSILDTFEASISNLEAQLSQREKQYEYYRNKLLTFE